MSGNHLRLVLEAVIALAGLVSGLVLGPPFIPRTQQPAPPAIRAAWYERFNQRDWWTETLHPFQPSVAGIYRGSNPNNSTAQIVGAALRYKFDWSPRYPP